MSDYIEREAALQTIESCAGWSRPLESAYEEIQAIHAADVAPVVHARWDDSLDGITPFCTACGCTHRCLIRRPLYCPNCGAKMDKEEV